MDGLKMPAPTFRGKQYKRLAQWLCDMKFASSQQSEAASVIATPLADMLQADNIRFDRDKFFKHVRKLYLEACTNHAQTQLRHRM